MWWDPEDLIPTKFMYRLLAFCWRGVSWTVCCSFEGFASFSNYLFLWGIFLSSDCNENQIQGSDECVECTKSMPLVRPWEAGPSLSFIQNKRHLILMRRKEEISGFSCRFPNRYVWFFNLNCYVCVHVQGCEKPHQPIQLLSLVEKDYSLHVKEDFSSFWIVHFYLNFCLLILFVQITITYMDIELWKTGVTLNTFFGT